MRRHISGGDLADAEVMALLPRRHSSSGLFHVSAHRKARSGGIAGSAFNLSSATLGAGTLALPYAFAQCGWLLSIGILAAVCACTVYSVHLLVCACEITGLMTLQQLANLFFGRWIEKLASFLIVLFCWGCAVIYVVATGDILDTVRQGLGYDGFIGRKTLITVFWLVFMLPLSIPEEISSLRHASLVGVVSTAVLVLAISVHAVEGGASIRALPLANVQYNTLFSVSTFIFSFCCQPVVFQVYAELHQRSTRRMNTSSCLAMVGCTLMYIIVGLFGAADFQATTADNILKNYENPAKEPYLLLAFVCFGMTVTLAFPINLFPTRDAVLQEMGYTDGVTSTPRRVRIIVTTLICFSALLTGLFVPSISVLLALFGGICGGSVGFLFPALFVLRTEQWTPELVGWPHVIATWSLLVLGCAACILGTYTSVVSTFL